MRNFVGLAHGEQPPFEIYVKEKAVLNQQHERAYQALGIDAAGKEGKRKGTGDQVEQARGWMCRNFFDVRTFGAVMSTGTNCGQVRGPVQITFGRSIDPVVSSEHAITRMAVTTDAEAEKQQGDNRTMGRKFTVPYGLYRAHGFVSAPLAEQTGFSDDDLELLWKSLEQMFEHDHSAARGQMSSRRLLLFKHDDRLGNARPIRCSTVLPSNGPIQAHRRVISATTVSCSMAHPSTTWSHLAQIRHWVMALC